MTPVEERVEVLRRVPIFARLAPPSLAALAQIAYVKQLTANEELFHKGDRGVRLYVIVRGRLKVGTTSPDGTKVVFNIMDPGEVFGELALLSGGLRTGTVTALGKAELLGIDRRHFLDSLRSEPDVAIELLAVLAERVSRVSEQVEDTIFLNLSGRLAKKLLDLADAYGRETESGVRIELELSQGSLGEMVGTSRESINKQIRSWAQDGIVAMERQRVTIRRQDALERIAGGGGAGCDGR